MSDVSMSDLVWHGNQCEVFWMLYLNRYDVVTVIEVQDFDLGDYHAHKFVRNSEGKYHAFDEEDKAIVFLNQKYEKDQIDPEYRRELDDFLTRD